MVSVVDGGGLALETVTVMGAESVVLPALSVAGATSVYGPSPGWVLQVTAYGAVVSAAPITVPAVKSQLAPAQKRNSTWATPESASLALAVRLTPLLTVVPAAGAVIATLGGVVSGGPVLVTVTVTGGESVVLPTLSVARASRVYDPSAGWVVHATE